VTLVSKTRIGSEPCEIALAVGEPLERSAGSQPLSMRRDRMTSPGAEDTAKVMGRNGEKPAESNQRPFRRNAQGLPDIVDQRLSRSRRRRATRRDPGFVDLIEQCCGQVDRPLGDIAWICSGLCLREQGAVLEVESRGRRNRHRGQARFATPDGTDQLLVEENRRAVVAVCLGVVVAVLDAGVDAVGEGGIEGRLGAIGPARKASTPHEHEGGAPVVKLDLASPGGVAAAYVLDLETLVPENGVGGEHRSIVLSSKKVQDRDVTRGQALRQ
jgi:hypothetical protein